MSFCTLQTRVRLRTSDDKTITTKEVMRVGYCFDAMPGR